MHQTFLSREAALSEADGDEEDNCVTLVQGHVSTKALDVVALQDRPSAGTAEVLDLLLPIYADEVLRLDGVWWNERLDPSWYSAPRGVIPSHSVGTWKITRCACDPDADADY
ncbi:hypothetical protein [Sphingomonas sp. 3-13AW]|uniref:hypothetical protein n=1 Tax=Sphingomonas sp. 3-13AW TaxID=3050450 RepID=UPI003BB5793D